MPILSTTISDNWQVAERLKPGRDLFLPQGGEKTWLPATVPGHVHLDLVKAGAIGDPFFRMQEAGCQWVDEADWTYRATFTVDAERLAARGAQGHHFLHFHGLDTLARVYLNDTLLGTAENFFLPYRFDVTDRLQEGENTLRVEFDSALQAGRERAAAYLGDGTSEHGQQTYFNFPPRAFVRKPQYMFGWDWGPELVSCGIWQPVELITIPDVEIVDWRIAYTFSDAVTTAIQVEVTVEKYTSAPLRVGVALYAPGDNTPSENLPDAPGRYTVTLSIPHQKVVRWSPNGSGTQKRYLLNLRVWEILEDPTDAPIIVAHKGVSIGFRTAELIQEPDADGKGASFLFRINGLDTYIKGANWIPDGCFPGAITDAQLRQRLTQARDAGFNMLRIWGGGLYESDTFYSLCDELGLLVWQDFAFSCAMYPDDLPEFRELVRQEAATAVRRLRHHPSLTLWCGGNENVELFENRWSGAAQATQFFGDKLIHEDFPTVLAAEDPHTPYWPNSPYSGVEGIPSKSPAYGDEHYWRVWHAQSGSTGDWVHYAESDCRFSSEFGFAAPAGPNAWKQCMVPTDQTVSSLVSHWHDKTRKGYETYLSYIGLHFPKPHTFADLIYYGQANQAEALKFGVEHWRRLKGRCWGTLFWQLNDCWPTHSWSVIDSAGEPKAACYAAKRFYAPLLVSLKQTGATIEAHVVNDTLRSLQGQLVLRLVSCSNGDILQETRCDVNVAANTASGILVTLEVPTGAVPSVAHATFVSEDGENNTENHLLLDEPKNALVPGTVSCAIAESTPEGTAVVTFGPYEHFTDHIWLQLEGFSTSPTFSDNWFSLLPGATKQVQITGLPATLSPPELRHLLHIRCLMGSKAGE
jgi:beta-mannosidase